MPQSEKPHITGYYRSLIGNPMLEVEPTGRRGRTEVAKLAKAYRFAAIGTISSLCDQLSFF